MNPLSMTGLISGTIILLLRLRSCWLLDSFDEVTSFSIAVDKVEDLFCFLANAADAAIDAISSAGVIDDCVTSLLCTLPTVVDAAVHLDNPLELFEGIFDFLLFAAAAAIAAIFITGVFFGAS